MRKKIFFVIIAKFFRIFKKFSEFIDSQVGQFRPNRAENQKTRANDMADRLGAAYNKQCAFFDPMLPNGGPRPSSDDQGRKRRDADDEEDPFDAYELSLQSGERSASVRLDADPALALRQVKILTIRYCQGTKFHESIPRTNARELNIISDSNWIPKMDLPISF